MRKKVAQKTWKKALSLILAVAMILSTDIRVQAFTAPVDEVVTDETLKNGFSENEDAYEIYPVPHSVDYGTGSFTMTEEVNVVVEDGIDTYTEAFLRELLTKYGKTVTKTDAVVSGKTNILLGIKDSGGKVDVASGITVKDTDLFTRLDPYVLKADNTANENGIITILGEDTNSVYYGVATLQMMFSSFAGKKFLPVQIEDYANGQYRGFIEGFYGGWDFPNREDLIRFARDVKMNTYVYASKTDKYHTSQWDVLYPQDQIDQFAELVEVGKESKVEFTWSVHLGSFFRGASTDPSNEAGYAKYQENLQKLMAKFDQFYEIGVRSFHLLNDDFGSGRHEDVPVLLNDLMEKYIDVKGDCRPLVYCPQGYNMEMSAKMNGDHELGVLKDVDPRVMIYWTGAYVNSPVMQYSYDYLYTLSGHDALTWLNYPVNEHAGYSTFLGHINFYTQGAKNLKHFKGLISNPCNRPQVDKVGLFQLGCWNWNNETYDDHYMEVWENCFKYLQPEVYDSYLTIARNVGAATNSGVPGRFPEREDSFPESDYLKDKLEGVLARAKDGTLKADDAEALYLLEEFDHILSAIADFRANCANAKLVSELGGALEDLSSSAFASKMALTVALAQAAGKLDEAWTAFGQSGSYGWIRGGIKRLQPFAQQLTDATVQRFYEILSPNGNYYPPELYAVIGGARQDASATNAMLDGNWNSVAKYNVEQMENDFYGVDLGAVRTVRGISILQGEKDGDANYFHNATLEYSEDGEQWTTLIPMVDSLHIELSDVSVRARYVRLRQIEKSTNKINVREFAVDTALGNFTAGGNAAYITDQNLRTAYTGSDGVLEYQMIEPVILQSVGLVQNTKTDITISVKTEESDSWIELGTINSLVGTVDVAQTQTAQVVALLQTVPVTAVKLEWSGEASIVELFLNGDSDSEGEAPLPLPSIAAGDVTNLEIEVNYGTELAQAGLPAQSGVTLSDGSHIVLPVTWSSAEYNPNAPKKYQVTGTYVMGDGIVNPGNIVIEATVKVRNDGSVPETFTGNLAENKKCQGSGYEAASGQVQPERAVDGIYNNRWVGGPAIKPQGIVEEKDQNAGVEWIIIDLNTGSDGSDIGGENELTDVTLKCFTDKSWPTKYDIYVSDEPFTVSGGRVSGGTKVGNFACEPQDVRGDNGSFPYPNGQVTTFDTPVTGRYVCVVFNAINKYAGGATGVSVTELEVHGTKSFKREVAPTENLALKDEAAAATDVFVSGVEVNYQTFPQMAVDGDANTRWSSNGMKTVLNDAWIVVDLGEDVADVTSISMEFFKKVWPTGYIVQFAGNDFVPQDYRGQNIMYTINAPEAFTGQNAVDSDIWTTVKTFENLANPDHPTDTVTKEEFENPIPEGARYIRLYFKDVNMDGAGFIGLEELTVNGNRFAPEAEPDVVSVAEVTASGVKGTEFEDLALPRTVVATLADGTSVNLPVTWLPDGYDKDSAEAQTLTGTLTLPEGITNTGDVKASLILTLAEEIKVVSVTVNPSVLVVPVGTAFADLDLPRQAVVKLNNGSSIVCDVTWKESGYDVQSSVAQTLTGTLEGPLNNPDAFEASIIVKRPDKTPPTTPEVTYTPGSGNGRTGAVINWTPSVDLESGLAGYQVYLDGRLTITTGACSYTYTNCFRPGTTHTVTVIALDVMGNQSEPGSVTFTTATIEIESEAPVIISQPKDQSVTEEEAATFTVEASGNGTVTYQWQKSTDNGTSWSDIDGAVDSTYTTNATVLADNGTQFRCVVTNTEEGKTPSVMNSDSALLTVIEKAPEVLTGTVTITGDLKYGQSLKAVLKDSNNTGDLQYQWKRGDTDIDGATSDTYITVKEDIGQILTCVITSSVETGSVSGVIAEVIAKADGPAAPDEKAFTVTDETVKGAEDGTIEGISVEMEYSADGGQNWTRGTGDKLLNLKPGDYLVRYAETDTHKAGETLSLTVKASDVEYVNVTYTLTYLTSDGVKTVQKGTNLAFKLTANEKYELPDSITVTVGGTMLTEGYSYNKETGEVTINSVGGDVVITAEGVRIHEHSYDQQNTDKKYLKSEANCTEKAVYYYSCSCGEKGTETFAYGEVLGHDWEKAFTIDREATCVTEGSKSHHCTRCTEVTDVTVIPVKEHEFTDWKVTTPPTCTESGTEERSCKNCPHKETRVADPLGHVTVLENIKEATCTEEGYTGDEVCTECLELIKKGEVIPKKAHDYQNGECVECGKPEPVHQEHVHTGNGAWVSDMKDHWKVCECGTIIEKEQHVLDINGECKVCHKVLDVPVPAPDNGAGNSNTQSPNTGDTMNALPLVVLLGVALIAAAEVLKRKKLVK